VVCVTTCELLGPNTRVADPNTEEAKVGESSERRKEEEAFLWHTSATVEEEFVKIVSSSRHTRLKGE